MSKVILCLDLQAYYFRAPEHQAHYTAICRDTNAFHAAAARRGIPFWKIFYDLSGKFTDLLIGADAPASLRRETLARFDRTDSGGLGGIALAETTPVFFKRGSSAFGHPALMKELHRHGIEEIYLTGFHEGDCVAATALDASNFGFATTLVSDLVFNAKPPGRLATGERARQILGLLQVKAAEAEITRRPAWLSNTQLLEKLRSALPGRQHNETIDLIRDKTAYSHMRARFSIAMARRRVCLGQSPWAASIDRIATAPAAELLAAFAARPPVPETRQNPMPAYG